jgi:hypothetical protein
MSAFPARWTALRSGAHLPETGIGRQWVSSEHRKNDGGFPVLRARHQRFVAEQVSMAADGNAATNEKAGARPAFCNLKALNGAKISTAR